MSTTETKLLTYQTLFAEGIIFLNRGLFKESIEVFTKCYTLLSEIEGSTDTIRTFIVHTLLHRSKAHLDIGGHSKQALADALKAFELNQSDPYALLAVAEAYYGSGEFEQALICFHRGLKARPDWSIFEKGIHKCAGVIESALSGNIKRKKAITTPDKTTLLKQKKVDAPIVDYSELEEINVDRIFMKELLHDKVFLAGIGDLKNDIKESVEFLESRVAVCLQFLN